MTRLLAIPADPLAAYVHKGEVKERYFNPEDLFDEIDYMTLDEDEVAKWRAGGGEDVQALIQGAVDRVNRDRSRFEQIKRFEILPRDFSAEHDEVTPTMKLRRRICEEHFASEIDALYASD